MDNYYEHARGIAVGLFEDFETQVSVEKNRWFTDVDRVTLTKELVVFNIFTIVVALESVFKKDQRGQEIVNDFIDECLKILSEGKCFEDISDAHKFVTNRLSEYSTDFNKEEFPGRTYWVAKRYCSSLRCFNPEIIRQVTVVLAESLVKFKEGFENVKIGMDKELS